jgi:hypothetical protein
MFEKKMNNVKLSWCDAVYNWFKAHWWIIRYGLDGAENKCDKIIKDMRVEIKKKENNQSIIDNWK